MKEHEKGPRSRVNGVGVPIHDWCLGRDLGVPESEWGWGPHSRLVLKDWCWEDIKNLHVCCTLVDEF